MKIIGRNKLGLHSLLERVCAMSVCLLTFMSCIYDDPGRECSLEQLTEGKYSVNLTISANSPATRAEEPPKWKPEEGNKHENFINIKDSDFAVFIFDGITNEFLMQFKPQDIEFKQDETDTYKYHISGTLVTNREVTAIRIMVLANWNNFPTGTMSADFYARFADTFSKKKLDGTDNTLDDIYKNAENFVFTMYRSADADADGVVMTWTPWNGEDGSAPKGIPMVGMSNAITLGSDQLLGSNETINMLRALAKVEIIDNTDENIQTITLSRAGANGRFIPDGRAVDDHGVAQNPNWYVQTAQADQQIATPSLPNPLNYVFQIGFKCYPEAAEVDGVKRNLFVAYIPEMHVASAKSGKERPEFTLTPEKGEAKNVKFDNYIDGEQNTANQLQSVLRNRIYSYIVNSGNNPIEIEYEVLPWTMEYNDEPLYFDTPTVKENGYLKWNIKEDEGGYDDDPDSGRLKMKSVTGEYVEATFTLSAPLHCKWIAQLVHVSDQNDAFYFTDGSPIMADDPEHPGDADYRFIQAFEPGGDSGVIDGKEITIRVACRNANAMDENYAARLVIMVEMPDNKRQEVIVVNPAKGYSNYIIWQEEQIMQ